MEDDSLQVNGSPIEEEQHYNEIKKIFDVCNACRLFG